MKTTTLLVLAAASLLLLTAAPANAIRINGPSLVVPCEPTPPPSSGGLNGFLEGALHGATTELCNQYDALMVEVNRVYGETVTKANEVVDQVEPLVEEQQDFACVLMYGEPDPQPERDLCREIVIGV
ncbi:MAG: hypothetical protein QOD77_920 [Thermoplasmata archaeon]|jgi:hypothetical protein|nr:hypothetical protein [Thermoplasmata archaeon]